VSLGELGWRTRSLPRTVGLGVVGFAACALVTFGLWFSLGPGRSGGEFVRAILTISTPQRLLFALIGLQAAFVEETLFRGYLQPALVARRGNFQGVLLTAMIFALYHLNFRPIALVGKLLFGVVFGVLRERDRGLFAPALAHALLWTAIGSM
jgi:membrane protease YdiL (CAAX protease family)